MNFSDIAETKKYFEEDREQIDYLLYFKFLMNTGKVQVVSIKIPQKFLDSKSFIKAIIKINIYFGDNKFSSKELEEVIVDNNLYNHAYKFLKNIFNDIIKTENDCLTYLKNGGNNLNILPDRFLTEDYLVALIEKDKEYIDWSKLFDNLIDKTKITLKIIECLVKTGHYILYPNLLKKLGLYNQDFFNLLFEHNDYIRHNYICAYGDSPATPLQFCTEEATLKYLKLTRTFRYIPEKLRTPEVIKKAIEIDYCNLGFINNPTDDICFDAINISYKAFDFIKGNPNDEIRMAAILALEQELL